MNAMPFAPIPAAFTLLLCQAIRAINPDRLHGSHGANLHQRE
jgi:hypothetical protein